MEFNGTFELEDTTTEEVWLALSDPVLVEESLPGCEFLVQVDDEDVDFDALREQYADRDVEPTADPDVIAERAFEEGERYAALVQISVGPVNPTFETVVTIDHREKPEMSASGEGSSGDSSFEMSSSMVLSEADDGVAVEWETQADVFGRVAQMGQRVVNPVANQVVKRFFSSVQEQLRDLSMATETANAADTADESSEGAAETGDETAAETGDESATEPTRESVDESGGGSDEPSLVDRILGRSRGGDDR
ncbi:CoxG family protein [Halobacterium zhouii]|uniref:CoxG family protein n=1 Tax=Halobacterium zhouii TaxID=2902624 RepID=UPI001E29DCA4|nr:SRPBCC domain-containing protein [Halobacterium zhouii]